MKGLNRKYMIYQLQNQKFDEIQYKLKNLSVYFQLCKISQMSKKLNENYYNKISILIFDLRKFQQQHQEVRMIRSQPLTALIQQKPRKLLKLDVMNQKNYNQFQGNSDIELEQHEKKAMEQKKTQKQSFDQESKYKNLSNQFSIDEEISLNEKIFRLISKQHIKYRKVGDQKKNRQNTQKVKTETHPIKKQQKSLPNIKFEEGQQPVMIKKQQIKDEKPGNKHQKTVEKSKQKKTSEPSSNWKLFLQSSNNPSKSAAKTQQAAPIKTASNFVSMDCEFVKCGQQDQLARLSIVSQDGSTLFDSYIKPTKKVTDFITSITGITFSHLRNAPLWSQQIGKVKKILLGKILVGHTLHKDLEVCKLTEWKGLSKTIDISEFSQYRQKNSSKTIGLKRLALSFLNRNIQSGWHSSVQDALATIDLFKLNKKNILKQFKLI